MVEITLGEEPITYVAAWYELRARSIECVKQVTDSRVACDRSRATGWTPSSSLTDSSADVLRSMR